MAARSLIVLLRQLKPRLLHHKDRGRPIGENGTVTTIDRKMMGEEFGELKVFFAHLKYEFVKI
jgi:hypothetical protein